MKLKTWRFLEHLVVLLSILEPHLQLPPQIDLCKFHPSQPLEQQPFTVSPLSPVHQAGGPSSKVNSHDDNDGQDSIAKMDVFDDASVLFAPPELRNMALSNISSSPDRKSSETSHGNISKEDKHAVERNFSNQIPHGLVLDPSYPFEYSNLYADYLQLMNHRDCELRASEFQRLALDLQSHHENTVESHDAAIDALLLAAECYVNPFFMLSSRDTQEVSSRISASGTKTSGNLELAEIGRIVEKNNNELEMVAYLERKRDNIVLHILLEAAKLDREYQSSVSDGELHPISSEESEEVIILSHHDIIYADAVTLVRQNQSLLCDFLVQRLQRKQQSMHEILMQSLLYLLHSATKLSCPPENVIHIILGSAEYLNGLLTSIYYEFKEGNLQLDPARIHEVRRRWMLLQRLVMASSGGEEGPEFSVNINNGFRFANLVPPATWMQKVSTFSSSGLPLVRFLGWMGVSRNAKQYVKEHIFLASDLSQLTNLLSIFADDLGRIDNIVEQKDEKKKFQHSEVKQGTNFGKGAELLGQQHGDQSFRSIYPEISQFFPNMKKQFETFGEIILEAVALQLRTLSASVVPDLLCWFSDLCSWPFLQNDSDKLPTHSSSHNVKGFVAKNAKAVILYILEAIVREHMEAMVPEIPRVIQVLVSLCRTSYCDVPFLDSVLRLLKPIISYSLSKVSHEEKQLTYDACLNFESLCFDELFCNIRQKIEDRGSPAEKGYSRALTIFILASVFPDLSFQRKRETLQSLCLWADFATSEPTTSFHDYICAFQIVMENCKVLLFETIRVFGVVPLTTPLSSDVHADAPCNSSSDSHSWFLNDICNSSLLTDMAEQLKRDNGNAVLANQKVCHLSSDEIESFSFDLQTLISKLNPTIELCWNIHHQLAKNLTLTSAYCFMYSKSLSSFAQQVNVSSQVENERLLPSNSIDQFPVHWKIGLEGVAEMIVELQENRCWEVASMILDCLLGVPQYFPLDNVIGTICSAIKKFASSAPKIVWRLQTDKWLSSLVGRGIHCLQESALPLVDLLCTMLGHPEPEQRFIALKHLGKLVGQDLNDGVASSSPTSQNKFISLDLVVSVPEPIISSVVSSTWDRVAVLASCDTSLFLRTRAMALLFSYIPLAERRHLQSLLAASDSLLYGFGKLGSHTREGQVTLFSLALISNVCLYSPPEDISLIPQNVWSNIERIGMSHAEGRAADIEKKACEALCRLKHEGNEAKEILKEVLLSSHLNQPDPEFESTRESVLQVLGNLTSVQSYFDFFSKKVEEKAMELEEAEIEMDLLQREQVLQESSNDIKEWSQLPFVAAYKKDDNRLQQIKDGIRSLEKSKLREEIVARRQKKVLVRRARQKYLEEAALREAELLQELDRERTTEVEREIERQCSLELERARTRELRHNLDIEKEKQTQREVQRELEQVESGLRPSRREFPSSTHSSRPRERYRERENGRPVNEGSLRSSGNLQSDTSANISGPTVVLSGSRQFSGQLPTILQSRDRQDDCGSSYEENFDGSKDSGDTGSVGDPELASTFEGQSGGFGSAQRHGSRGSKSRQIMERREREGRREGKWERKH